MLSCCRFLRQGVLRWRMHLSRCIDENTDRPALQRHRTPPVPSLPCLFRSQHHAAVDSVCCLLEQDLICGRLKRLYALCVQCTVVLLLFASTHAVPWQTRHSLIVWRMLLFTCSSSSCCAYIPRLESHARPLRCVRSCRAQGVVRKPNCQGTRPLFVLVGMGRCNKKLYFVENGDVR